MISGEIMANLDDIQSEVKAWARHNFPDQTPELTLLGVAEETGELCHAILKQRQLIRGTYDQHEAKAKDSVGDLLIYLLHLCTLKGWSLNEILVNTWDEVRQRDWVENPTTGAKNENFTTITTSGTSREGD